MDDVQAEILQLRQLFDTLRDEVEQLRSEGKRNADELAALKVGKAKKRPRRGAEPAEYSAPELAPRPGAEQLERVIDVPAERVAFEARTGKTPEAWLAAWRSNITPRDPANTLLSFRAAVVEVRDPA